MKRILAILLSLALVIGVVPSMGTVKAAGEVSTNLTYGGFADQPNVGTGRWLIYADLDTTMTAEITSTAHYLSWAFASMNDSTEEFSMDVYATSTNRIFYTMNYAKLGATTPSDVPVGTTVTIKARTMSGYMAPQNNFTIYWDGSAWKEIIVAGASTISSQQQVVLTTTNDVLQGLFDAKGSTSDMPLVGVGEACVYLNGSATEKTTVNYSKWGLYLDADSIKGSNYVAGDILTVKGLFSQNVNVNAYLELDESYICIETSGENGATWAYYSPMSIKINRQNVLYFAVDNIVANTSDYNVFGSTGASVTYNDVAISRGSNNYFLYTSGENALYLSLDECGISEQKAGDVLAVSGAFSCNEKMVGFGENWFVLQEDGSWLQVDEKPVVHICAGVKTNEVAATCVMPGNVAYWTCECGKIYADETCQKEITIEDTVLEPIAHDVIHFEAVEPGCHSNGNQEYWFCPECEGFWTDAACTQLTNSKNVNLPATGSDNVIHVEAKAPTCTELGNVEYWHCPDCEGFWTDSAYTQLTNSKSVILGEKGHKSVKVAAVAATTTKDGHEAGTKCSVCGDILTGCKVIAKIAKPAVSKVTKATGGKKKITIKFKKVSGISGYEIQIATKKNMKKGLKTFTVKASKAKYVAKKLKAKTNYWVRIRTYKMVNGEKVISNWSKKVKVKTK